MSIVNSEGFIEDNPFFKSVEYSPCALWVLKNESRVKRKIAHTLTKMGQKTYELDECYDYMIYYFIEFSHNEFDENYFKNKKLIDDLEEVESLEELINLEEEETGEEENEYKLEYYVLSRVHSVTLGYIRTLNQLKEIRRFDEENKFNEDGRDRNGHTISLDLASSKTKRIKRVEDDLELIVEFQELQDILDNDLHIYDEDFQSKGLKNFKTKRFVEALFLRGFESDEEICEFLEVNRTMLDKYRAGFKALVKNRIHERGEYRDLLDSIKQLVSGVTNGWTPVFNN